MVWLQHECAAQSMIRYFIKYNKNGVYRPAEISTHAQGASRCKVRALALALARPGRQAPRKRASSKRTQQAWLQSSQPNRFIESWH